MPKKSRLPDVLTNVDENILIEQENKTLRSALLLEVDRDTIEPRWFQEKIRGILTYIKPDRHVRRYKARKINVAFVTTGGQKRVEKMREWTRSELAKTHDTWDYGYTFVFTHYPILLTLRRKENWKTLMISTQYNSSSPLSGNFPSQRKKVVRKLLSWLLNRCDTSANERATKPSRTNSNTTKYLDEPQQ